MVTLASQQSIALLLLFGLFLLKLRVEASQVAFSGLPPMTAVCHQISLPFDLTSKGRNMFMPLFNGFCRMDFGTEQVTHGTIPILRLC